MRAAERRHRRQVPAGGDRLAHADPLVRPHHVVGVLACREQLAEDLLEDAEVVDLVAGDGGQRLVEQHHALLGAVAVDEAGAEVGEGHELEVGVTQLAGDGQRLPEALLLAGRSPSNIPRHRATHPRSGESAVPASIVCALASHPLITAPSPTTDPYR